jgi:hypothetical protein
MHEGWTLMGKLLLGAQNTDAFRTTSAFFQALITGIMTFEKAQ